MLRLVRIHTYALRSMVSVCKACVLLPGLNIGKYSLRSPKVLSDPQRAQEIVSELDSELNKWMDSIPEHRTSCFPSRSPAPLMACCSQVGPPPARRPPGDAVDVALRRVLRGPHHHPPPVHPDAAQAVAAAVPLARDLHERGALVHPGPRQVLCALRARVRAQPSSGALPAVRVVGARWG